ncbi:sodium channel protein Nach-like [Linepithema humile]|uniref:sodium channel protein Nach-like n=1 Tax=Linepithema humile TaxID=83485 RepID=UPI00351DED09
MGSTFLRIIKNTMQIFVEVYKEFLLESTIGGLKYMILAKTKLERFIWMIILLLSFFAAGRLTCLLYYRHQIGSINTFVITTQYSTSMLELPALTLCHGGIAMAHKMNPFLTSQKRIFMPRGLTRADFEESIKYLREAVYSTNSFPDEIDKLQQILSANQLSLVDLFENINANCSDFLLMCQFEGKTVNCSELIEPVLTPYGICCAFNYENSHRQRSTKLLKRNSGRVGLHFILSFLMKSYSSKDYISSLMQGDGVKVMVHERNSYPSAKVLEFFSAAGHETIAQLDGTRTTSTSDVLGLPSHLRGCSSGLRRDNRQDNCYNKCRDDYIQEHCGCHPLSARPIERGKQWCNLNHIPCMARILLFSTYKLMKYKQCNCLPNCEGTTYRVALTAAPLNAAQYSPNPFYKKVLEYQNVTALHLTFVGQTAMLQKRKLMFSNINLLSSLGGVFGLFLGCSIISIIEILYFFCIFFVRKFQSRDAQRKIWMTFIKN